MKGILERAIEIRNQIRREYNKQNYQKFNDYEGGHHLMMEKFGEAISNIKLITGWAGPGIYDTPEMYKIFDNLLKRGRDIFIVFNKETKDLNKAIELFKIENSGLCKLKEKYPEHLRIYWTKDLPSQHYALIDDNKYVFFETKHHRNKVPKALYFKQNDIEFGNNLNNTFNKFIELEKTKEILN